jgi:eukaryotic-like serine/threonine-protein kinase
VDADVAELVRAERLLEAAALAVERGDARTASHLYERACDWARASSEALRAGEPARALQLAAQAGDVALAGPATTALAADPVAAEATAARLVQRGQHRWAAPLLEAIGRKAEAAHAWERAGDTTRAAELMEAGGDPAAAARVLEAALRREPRSWGVAVALGALLARFGKHEAAVRALQRVPPDAPERRAALGPLVRALEHLGLQSAAADATMELGAPPPSEQPERPAPAQRLFGRYDVAREVASSPGARVLECADIVRGDRVAVKVFAGWDARGAGRDALVRFEREVRTMRALDHPGIVPLREYVPDGPAIVMDWMAGGTLERMLATTGALAPARAVEIAVSVLLALGEAHRVGILHRDVKPANVLFDEAGGARLSDFGVAHLGDASTTATAGVFGTLAYMSPEQREGRPATARSDVFAVGTLLREMLTGERPVPGRAPRVRPSDAHDELHAGHDEAVEQLAAIDPAGRPPDAFVARSALLALAWPGNVQPGAARPRSERAASLRPLDARLQAAEGGVAMDTWTGRWVERIPHTERSSARARAFAAADHEALQLVLRVDPADATIWLEAARGRPLDRRLTAPERARLEAGLAALHAAGAVHGHVDADHVVVCEPGVVLRFEVELEPTATIDRDRLALAGL